MFLCADHCASLLLCPHGSWCNGHWDLRSFGKKERVATLKHFKLIVISNNLGVKEEKGNK